MEHQGVPNTSRPHAGGREDCWSEGATETLIEAWGNRYLRLNRGNLRQKDWKEVADAVNGRQNGVKPPRTDIQCKNRIDTLKKKYKTEKSKPSPSKWPFYSRLGYLIGPNSGTPSSKKSATTVTLTVKSKQKQNPNPNFNAFNFSGGSSRLNFNAVNFSGGSSRLNSSGSNESSLGNGGRQGENDDDGVFGVRKHNRMDSVDLSEESAYKELARAILRFGEIYERIESSKQQQMMELEKQRMEFTKELECQRMNMFMETQLELEKMKRSAKQTPGSGKKLS